ncbi:hypothetical protein EDD17DRAFT_1558984 [Pisolithus thermaeus]|nr:hypothetical protein EDD17DRAFT_1558984 [Pisolithus thermaeus]
MFASGPASSSTLKLTTTMEPTIERPLRAGSDLFSMNSPCNLGFQPDYARSRSSEPGLHSDSSVSTAHLPLPGLAIEGVSHGTETPELSLQVGTERHTVGDMLETPTVRTQHLGSDSNCEEKHTGVTEVNERLETTDGACGTPFLLAEMNGRVLEDDDASGAVDNNPPSSSLPPSSSPAQVFSSSPLASTQSSFVPSDKVTGITETKEYIPPNVLSETRTPLVGT